MSARHTVTVYTADHGPVTIPEPLWCVGDHPAEGYRVDIEHTGPEIPLVINTLCHGPVQVFEACLMQRPFSGNGTTRPVVAVHLDDWHEYDAAALHGLADELTAFAMGPLADLAARLERLAIGGLL